MSAITTTSPNSTRRHTRRNREISLSWQTGPSGMRRMVAECADSITTMMFIGRPIWDESDPAALLAGTLGAMMVAEHQGQCASCRRWARRAS